MKTGFFIKLSPKKAAEQHITLFSGGKNFNKNVSALCLLIRRFSQLKIAILPLSHEVPSSSHMGSKIVRIFLVSFSLYYQHMSDRLLKNSIKLWNVHWSPNAYSDIILISVSSETYEPHHSRKDLYHQGSDHNSRQHSQVFIMFFLFCCYFFKKKFTSNVKLY